jgi:hypothetical protein
MNKQWIFFFLAIPIIGFTQDPPQGTNQINVRGIAFSRVVDTLQARGYEIKWIDNNHKTVRTTFKEAPDPNGRRSSFVYVSLRIRVKDSTALISAKWYNAVYLNSRDDTEPVDSELLMVEWAPGDALQLAFKQMDSFAKLFDKEISYTKAQ